MSPPPLARGGANGCVLGGGADLEGKPILSDRAYRLLPAGVSLPDRGIVTSPVIAIDLSRLGWARTISRWHRLGPPLARDAE